MRESLGTTEGYPLGLDDGLFDGIKDGAGGDGIAAEADGGHWSNGIEDLEEEALVDLVGQVTDVEGSPSDVTVAVGGDKECQ